MLPYVNLLLMMYAGAGLVTSAQLLAAGAPRAAQAAAGAGGLALLLLGLLLQAALGARARRRLLLCTYSVCMSVMVACELTAAAWLGWRLYSTADEKSIYGYLKVELLVPAALCALCAALQTLGAVMAARAHSPAAAPAPPISDDKNTLLLSCLSQQSDRPRCLRPLSGADYFPSASLRVREKDDNRRSRRSKGWQLQPQGGWGPLATAAARAPAAGCNASFLPSLH